MYTPCDEELVDYDENGKEIKYHRCPYEDSYGGYESEMCRVCCGVGVDE